MPRRARILTWNGKDFPSEFRELRAGRYVVETVDDEAPALSPEAEGGHRSGARIVPAGPRCRCEARSRDHRRSWIVAWPELEAAAADGVLTISELAALPSLQVGEASSFLETIRNSVPAQRGGGEEVVATGTLLDGRSFVVHINEKLREGVHLLKNVRIDIE